MLRPLKGHSQFAPLLEGRSTARLDRHCWTEAATPRSRPARERGLRFGSRGRPARRRPAWGQQLGRGTFARAGLAAAFFLRLGGRLPWRPFWRGLLRRFLGGLLGGLLGGFLGRLLGRLLGGFLRGFLRGLLGLLCRLLRRFLGFFAFLAFLLFFAFAFVVLLLPFLSSCSSPLAIVSLACCRPIKRLSGVSIMRGRFRSIQRRQFDVRSILAWDLLSPSREAQSCAPQELTYRRQSEPCTQYCPQQSCPASLSQCWRPFGRATCSQCRAGECCKSPPNRNTNGSPAHLSPRIHSWKAILSEAA